jgi:septal ring factor EnvC (AmiA/AmiB activator)
LNFVLLLAATLFAQNTDLDRIRSEIARLRRRLEDVRAQQRSAARDLEEASIELDIRTRELEAAVDTQHRLEQEQRANQAAIAAIAPRLQREKAFLARRVVALYRLGAMSYARLFLSIDERRDPMQAMSMLSFLVHRDARTVTRFENERAQLAVRNAELIEQQKKIAETRRVVEDRQRAVAQARAQKERVLASLNARESTQAQQVADLEEKARRLERLVDLLSKQHQGVVTTADIRSFQGALGWPVQGRLFERFGRQTNPKFATVTISNGVKIVTAPGTPVHAIFQGTVLYSQWFKGYGNLIILDHGNRVFSLYGNLKSPAVKPGEIIAAGQAIAGAGESEETRSGCLYFEIRQDNKPDDPQKWLR